MPDSFRLIGRGVYSLADAERLIGVPRKRIRRWTVGYTFRTGDRRHYSPPIIASDMQEVVGIPALDFVDLIEVRFLDAFLKYGVSWRTIRIAALRAREVLGLARPFSSRKFKTDGRNILAELVEFAGDRMLVDLVRNQYEFESVVSPMLYEGIEFGESNEPNRWWPRGRSRHVVIDPQRMFGAPIIASVGIPTRVLANAVAAENSVADVAMLFDVEESAVAAAVEYERELDG